MADEQVQTVPPGFNEAALLERVASTVSSTISGIREQAAQQDAAAAQAAQAKTQWAGDPVAQTIAPYIAPLAQQMNLRVQAAEDKGDFYLGHPEAADFKGEVESMFNQLMTQGRPMEREAVWYYFKGRNEKLFADRAAAQAKESLSNAARGGMSVGGSDMARPGGAAVDMSTFHSLPLEKKRELIGNTPF